MPQPLPTPKRPARLLVPAAAIVLLCAAAVAAATLSGEAKEPSAEPTAARSSRSVERLRSRPDLRPPAVVVRHRARRTAPGLIFLAAKKGPGHDGPLIVDERGELVWTRSTGEKLATDLRVQRYEGEPVLTWWEGRAVRGGGRGEYVVLDSSYSEVARVRAGRGFDGDLHEFVLTPEGTALMTIYEVRTRDLRSVGGLRRGRVLDSLIQEVDVETGRVLFQWSSLDHIDLDESYKPVPDDDGTWDYTHLNSIDVDDDDDGDLIVSARNTHAVYKIDRDTGRIIWRLGGRESDFRMGRGTRVAWAHDAQRQPDGLLSVLDNRGTPKTADESRGVLLRLDEQRRRVRLVREYTHPRGLMANNQANMQVLPNGNVFIGWGYQPYASEFSRSGRLLFDMRFRSRENDSYRAYRFEWTGRPAEDPAIAVRRRSGGGRTVYASWNGATEVARWRVLAGPSGNRLEPAGSAPRRGFETAIRATSAERWIAVEALDAAGEVLGRSRAVRG